MIVSGLNRIFSVRLRQDSGLEASGAEVITGAEGVMMVVVDTEDNRFGYDLFADS